MVLRPVVCLMWSSSPCSAARASFSLFASSSERQSTRAVVSRSSIALRSLLLRHLSPCAHHSHAPPQCTFRHSCAFACSADPAATNSCKEQQHIQQHTTADVPAPPSPPRKLSTLALPPCVKSPTPCAALKVEKLATAGVPPARPRGSPPQSRHPRVPSSALQPHTRVCAEKTRKLLDYKSEMRAGCGSPHFTWRGYLAYQSYWSSCPPSRGAER